VAWLSRAQQLRDERNKVVHSIVHYDGRPGWSGFYPRSRNMRRMETREMLPPRFPEFDFWVPQGERKLARMSIETLAGESHQTWAYERAAQVWRFDVFREPHDGDTWICRRDTSIRRPYPEVFELSVDGIPYLRPEICLLFKAKAVRDKDRADFEAALPRMSPAQRAWLHTALERVHPGNDWISATE
jgi:hypothetical protein